MSHSNLRIGKRKKKMYAINPAPKYTYCLIARVSLASEIKTCEKIISGSTKIGKIKSKCVKMRLFNTNKFALYVKIFENKVAIIVKFALKFCQTNTF